MVAEQKKVPFLLADVAPAVPLSKTLSYRIPPLLDERVVIGSRVLVPLGKRMVTGYVVGICNGSAPDDLKPIESVLDQSPLFTIADLEFFRWIASYYCCPLGEVIKHALPTGINIETVKHLSITPLGENALLGGELESEARCLLEALHGKKQVAVNVLRKTYHSNTFTALATALLDTSYVSVHQRQRSRAVQALKEKVYRLCTEHISGFSFSHWKQLCKRAPRQFAIMKWLRHVKEARHQDITRQWGTTAPSILKALEKKEYIKSVIQERYRTPLVDGGVAQTSSFDLTAEQAAALGKIIPALEKGAYAPFLLHGVTGSGKTEIYLRAVEATLRTGRGALVLVPEISLTPQLTDLFAARFGNRIAQIHSGLSDGERFDEWRRIRTGDAPIVIGARSALFAPIRDLGIIVVDEEHDSAYKQDQRFRYHARDLALVRGKMNHAVVILGSATPMLETCYNAQIGKLHYVRLSRRVDDRPLPQVEVVDMRTEKPGTMLSALLKEAIRTRWKQGEQTLLFLNRRGFARVMLCRQCGFTFHCPHCAVSLVYHQQERRLRCHYCGHGMKAPQLCPNCHSSKLSVLGFGTERLEVEVRKAFPGLQIARLDRDTTSRKDAMATILKQFRQGKTELLIGTQMIALGHDLPRVTLVGIVAADASLNFPDFRAGERTFQLLTQVSGRSGRGEVPGNVIIQTYNPSYPSIQMALRHDFQAFLDYELAQRKELVYPPFSRMVNVRMVGDSLERTRAYATSLGSACQELLASDHTLKSIEMLGPAEAPWEKLKGKYRWQMLFKSKDRRALHRFTEMVIDSLVPRLKKTGVITMVDIDPINLL